MATVIGIDFDNTIVSYDGLFWRLGRELGLIPPSVGTSKDDVRDYLRGVGREDDWTELQGIGYGSGMARAEMFPGVLDFMGACRTSGIRALIISHKTLQPFRGPACDLHEAAYSWLRHHGVLDPPTPYVDPSDVHFEVTKQAKLDRIGHEGCTHFVDDLPEFLAEPAFPDGVTRILFDPHGRHRGERRFPRVDSWPALQGLLADRLEGLS